MESIHRSECPCLPLTCSKRKVGMTMKYRPCPVDLAQKWSLAVPALLIFSFSPVPSFLRTARAEAPPQPPPAAQAPEQKTAIEGTWQGTLHSGKDYRDVVKITKADDGGYKVVFYLPDQNGNGFTPTNVTVDGPTVKMTLPFGTYAGKLSPDGKTITGTWTQDGNSLPLIFTRATPETEWTIPPPTPEMPPMSADSNPGVEVATIKPAKPDAQGGGFIWDGREIKAINKTLANLICTVYNIQSKQIVGAPDWVFNEKFDVTAKPDMPGRPSLKQAQGMTRQLLADRFQLKFHHDKREMSAYVLTAIADPPKMTKDTDDPTKEGLFFGPMGTLHVHNAPMLDFTQLLQGSLLDRPVVDQTGLTGRWDFVLKWTPDESQFDTMGIKAPPPSDAADAPPPLFTAIREQLGLKLSSEKTAVDMIVIDHVDHPSPN